MAMSNRTTIVRHSDPDVDMAAPVIDIEVIRSKRRRQRRKVIAAAVVSTTACFAIVCSQGSLPWWALVLTLGQASSMLLCSRDLRVGWAFGLTLQAPWATYDVVTGQYSFLVTSVLVSVAQIGALRRLSKQARVDRSIPETKAGLVSRVDEATNN